MIKRRGQKLSPNQLAKQLVMDFGGAAAYWEERLGYDEVNAMTEREKAEVYNAVMKQIERVEKFLGVEYYG